MIMILCALIEQGVRVGGRGRAGVGGVPLPGGVRGPGWITDRGGRGPVRNLAAVGGHLAATVPRGGPAWVGGSVPSPACQPDPCPGRGRGSGLRAAAAASAVGGSAN